MPPESALPDLLPYKLETSSHYKDENYNDVNIRDYKDVNQSHEMPKPVCKAGDPGEAALGVWQGLCPAVAVFCGVFAAGRVGGVSAPGVPRPRPTEDQPCSCSQKAVFTSVKNPQVAKTGRSPWLEQMRKIQAPVLKLPAHYSRNILPVNLLLIIQGK